MPIKGSVWTAIVSPRLKNTKRCTLFVPLRRDHHWCTQDITLCDYASWFTCSITFSQHRDPRGVSSISTTPANIHARTHNDTNCSVKYVANTRMLEVRVRVRYVANTSHPISQWGELTRDVCSSHKPPDCTGEISITRRTMFWHLFTLVAQWLKVSFSTLAEFRGTLMRPACLSVLIDNRGCQWNQN